MITKDWAEANIGIGVVYESRPGVKEYGIITRCTARGAFVRYRDHSTGLPLLTRYSDLSPVVKA